jgi:hypothetical protein
MLATILDWSLQLLGTGPDLHKEADSVIRPEKVVGHMLLPTTVTPMGANVCPGGQKIGDSCMMKYAA